MRVRARAPLVRAEQIPLARSGAAVARTGGAFMRFSRIVYVYIFLTIVLIAAGGARVIETRAMAQQPSDFGCPAGKPATPSPGPAFVPTFDCNGWVPANHPLAHPRGNNPSPSPAPSPTPVPAGNGACPPGQPPSPSPGPGFVPTFDCRGWVPANHPLARTFDKVIDANKDAQF